MYSPYLANLPSQHRVTIQVLTAVLTNQQAEPSLGNQSGLTDYVTWDSGMSDIICDEVGLPSVARTGTTAGNLVKTFWKC